MQTEANSKIIDDIEFKVYMLPPLKSHKLLLKLVKMIGPVLGPVFDRFYGNDKSAILDEEISGQFFTTAVSKLLDELDENKIDEFISAFKNVTWVPGANGHVPLKNEKGDQFDSFFMGKLDLMYKWLIFAMQVQWGKCLSALVNTINSQSANLK